MSLHTIEQQLGNFFKASHHFLLPLFKSGASGAHPASEDSTQGSMAPKLAILLIHLGIPEPESLFAKSSEK